MNSLGRLWKEGALVEVAQLCEQKASPRPALRLFLGADSLQNDCKGKSLTLKYFFHLWKYYIKQSRVQWLTLLLGMLVFSSPLFACNNGKLHKVRKWDQHKGQTNFHIKGLAQLFLQPAFNDIFSPVTRLRLQAFSGNLGRLSILAGKHVLFFVFLSQKEMAVIILISEKLDVISSLKRTEIIGKETCFHLTQKVSQICFITGKLYKYNYKY